MKFGTQNPDFDKGMEMLFAEHFSEGIDYLGRSLRADPTNPQAHLNRAQAFNHLDDYEHEIEECDKAIELYNAGWVYRRRHSEKVGTSDPSINNDLANAYALRGIAKYNLKQQQSAVSDFDEAVRHGTKDWRVYSYRGEYYLDKDSLDNAL